MATCAKSDPWPEELYLDFEDPEGSGAEHFTFGQVAELLSQALGRKIDYVSLGLLRFFLGKQKEGVGSAYIFVLIMLHYLARFQQVPAISPDLPNSRHPAPVH